MHFTTEDIFSTRLQNELVMNACRRKSAAHNFVDLHRRSISALPGKGLKIPFFYLFISNVSAGNTTICRGQNLAPQIRVEGRPALGEEHRLRLFQKKVLGGVIGWKREEKRRG